MPADGNRLPTSLQPVTTAPTPDAQWIAHAQETVCAFPDRAGLRFTLNQVPHLPKTAQSLARHLHCHSAGILRLVNKENPHAHMRTLIPGCLVALVWLSLGLYLSGYGLNFKKQ